MKLKLVLEELFQIYSAEGKGVVAEGKLQDKKFFYCR